MFKKLRFMRHFERVVKVGFHSKVGCHIKRMSLLYKFPEKQVIKYQEKPQTFILEKIYARKMLLFLHFLVKENRIYHFLL